MTSPQARPAFHIEQHARVDTIENILATFDADASQSDYLQWWWIPHTNLARYMRRNITTAPITATPLQAAIESIIDKHITNPYYGAVLGLERAWPALVPWVHERFLPWFFGGRDEMVVVKKSFDALMGNIPDMYEVGV